MAAWTNGEKGKKANMKFRNSFSIHTTQPLNMRNLFILLFIFLQIHTTCAAKPNVLFIAIDDQNDWVGCLKGHPQIKTPNIDALARRGTLFQNAHCQSPLCNSSRTSLMTGLRPTTTGIYGLAPWFRDLPEYKNLVSLPQHMKAHGYKTYMAGKIYHGRYGFKKGQKEFDIIGPRTGPDKKLKKKLVNTPSKHPAVDWGHYPHQDESKPDYKIASWAVSKLKAMPKEEPFFLSVGFFLPHVPCYATKKWFGLYPEETLKLPPFLATDRQDTPRFSWYLHWMLPEPRYKFLDEAKQWKNLVRSYMACTSFIDSQVGRILDALKSTGLDKNTIVVLWSDHGFHLGEKLITGKNTLWERSTRVPLIFSGPGVTSNQECTQPAELLDLFPTLSELCGLPVLKENEGHSLLPLLRDAKSKRPWPAITVHNHDNNAVRSERWRYIRYADQTEELYDMKKDPNEWNNLANDKQYEAVKKEHAKWIPKNNAMPAPGSRHRILTYKNGKATWQGKAIHPKQAIPGI